MNLMIIQIKLGTLRENSCLITIFLQIKKEQMQALIKIQSLLLLSIINDNIPLRILHEKKQDIIV